MTKPVALVTGAGRGLGHACSVALACEGFHVVAVSRTEVEITALVNEIEAQGGSGEAIVCDVTDGRADSELIARIRRLDVLVNSAGTNRPQPVVDVDLATLDAMLALNVRAAFLVAQAAARRMLSDGTHGSIINMSSQMGHVGAPNRSVYCMTKHAIEGMTKAMAVELAPQGIRVNSVAPTFVATPLTQAFLQDRAFSDWVLERIPLGRLARPEEIAAAIVFLAKPTSGSVTGTSLKVDGGWTAQ
jgi:NAD(P)-dependent dehydrogenase (short-subunit alcohol dehydrogenase family)